MRIGLDFDNTIIDYGDLFAKTALGKFPALDIDSGADKSTVRRSLRALVDGETLWQQVQTQVYGTGIAQARPYVDVKKFLLACLKAGHDVFVVSHKTRFAAQDTNRSHDLHQAAQNWLERNGLFDSQHSLLCPEHCFFLPSRREKCLRIAELQCDWFVDDLPEVFADNAFPRSTQTLLFRGGDHSSQDHDQNYTGLVACSWKAVQTIILL